MERRRQWKRVRKKEKEKDRKRWKVDRIEVKLMRQLVKGCGARRGGKPPTISNLSPFSFFFFFLIKAPLAAPFPFSLVPLPFPVPLYPSLSLFPCTPPLLLSFLVRSTSPHSIVISFLTLRSTYPFLFIELICLLSFKSPIFIFHQQQSQLRSSTDQPTNHSLYRLLFNVTNLCKTRFIKLNE